MTVPFVHSNYARKPNDHYPTIDKRCVYGFLEHCQPSGLCVDVCAPSGSGIVDTLIECGYRAAGLPDAFTSTIAAHWIVTNPPYTRPDVDRIIMRQIQRIETYEVYGVAVLLRANFDFAKTRGGMFGHPCYTGQIKLRFRPWWSESHKKQPIHNYVWQLWTSDSIFETPVVLYSDGAQPNKGMKSTCYPSNF